MHDTIVDTAVALVYYIEVYYVSEVATSGFQVATRE